MQQIRIFISSYETSNKQQPNFIQFILCICLTYLRIISCIIHNPVIYMNEMYKMNIGQMKKTDKN